MSATATSENHTSERLNQMSKLFDEVVTEANNALEQARKRVDLNLWGPIQIWSKELKIPVSDFNFIKREYVITIEDIEKAKTKIADLMTEKEKLIG